MPLSLLTLYQSPLNLLLSLSTSLPLYIYTYAYLFPFIPSLLFYFSSLIHKLCLHHLHSFFPFQFRSKLESALMDIGTSTETGGSDLLTFMDDCHGNRISSGAAVSHCIDPISDSAGCYGKLYRSVSVLNPTETERSSRRLTTDVLRFVRSTNSTIKQHVSEVARLDDMLQILAENYFPETFYPGDSLSESQGHIDTVTTADPTRDPRSRHPPNSGPAFHISRLEDSGRSISEKVLPDADHSGKNIRFSFPVNEIADNVEKYDVESANKSRYVPYPYINISSDFDLLTADVGRAPSIARSSVQYSGTSASIGDYDPLDLQTATYGNLAGARLGSNSTPSHGDSKSAEASSLIGKMPPRTFSTQLKKKESVVERRNAFENGVLDTRLKSDPTSRGHRNDDRHQLEDKHSIK